MTALARIFEGLGKHDRTAIDARDLKTGLNELHGMTTGASGNIQYLFRTMLAQFLDEEFTLTAGPSIPVGKLVPLFTKACTYSSWYLSDSRMARGSSL
jgi:hypothetical protein